MALSEKQLKDIINGVHGGKYNLANLPYSLFAHTASELVEAFDMGWGKPVLNSPDIYSPDIAKFNSFRKNIWYFGANKTVAQMRELNDLMHDQEGNKRSLYDFTKDALKVDKQFNVQHLAAEYDLTNKLAHNAREWKEIEETKDVFPILEWVAVMDSNTRHAKFNGIKLPVDDPFWGTHPQPLEYGCRCRKRQHRDAMVTDAATIADIPAPPKRPWHANPWRTAELWRNNEHPYGVMTIRELRATEKLIETATKELPLVVTHRHPTNGAVIREHPMHTLPNEEGRSEGIRNRESAIAIMELGQSVDLLENYNGVPKGKKSPDALIDGKWVADFKRASWDTLIMRINGSVKQGASIAVIQLDHSDITAVQAAEKMKGELLAKKTNIKPQVKEVWFVSGGKVVKYGKNWSDETHQQLLETKIAEP